jgi:hypothetical protein
MLPEYIAKQMKDAERFENYEINESLFEGEHYKLFNIDEQEKKLNKYEYIAYDILAQAVGIKVDLIWREAPEIHFESEQTQKVFDELRASTRFDEKMRNATQAMLIYGDSPVKVAVDDNSETKDEKLELCLYNLEPENWFPDYNEYNPAKPAKANTLIFEKKIEKLSYYLLETHEPSRIIWTAFEKTEDKDEYLQVRPLDYFNDELSGVVADGAVETDFEITYTTNCQYSLLHVLRNDTDPSDYFGVSDFTLPVVSKINALNNFANLANFVIATNSIPKLILSENASKMLSNIIENINSQSQGAEIENPTSFLQDPKTTFLNKTSYLQSYIYREMLNKMKAFEDGGRGETKYLTNNFDLEQIRKQHEIFFNTLMSELSISEVLYNPKLTTGALSGVAYTRLMSTTINAIDNIKRKLEPFIQKVVYTMLDLANNANVVNVEAQMPQVKFRDGIVNDSVEDLDAVIKKVQNQLLPTVEAIKQANNITIEEAKKYEAEIQASLPEPVAVEGLPKTENL